MPSCSLHVNKAFSCIVKRNFINEKNNRYNNFSLIKINYSGPVTKTFRNDNLNLLIKHLSE